MRGPKEAGLVKTRRLKGFKKHLDLVSFWIDGFSHSTNFSCFSEASFFVMLMREDEQNKCQGLLQSFIGPSNRLFSIVAKSWR